MGPNCGERRSGTMVALRLVMRKEISSHSTRSDDLRFASICFSVFLVVGCAADNDGGPGAPNGDDITDVTLDPPVSLELGWQYSIPSFPVDPGVEVQQCFFFTVPSAEQAFVSRIEIAQTTGTHHMNIFRVKTIKNLDGENGTVVRDGECWKPTNWSDWPLVVNSQNEGHVEFNLPEGVAHRFEAREKLMLQTHYVNATTQATPGLGKV